MSKRAQPYLKKPFESDGRSSDVSANIYFSMLTSPAWLDLTSNQKNLYLICKMQLYAEKHKPDGDRSLFTLNQAKWAFTVDKNTGERTGVYQLYNKSNAASFYADMQSLIRHGFVRVKEHGGNGHFKTIYQFSDKWQRYGKPDFNIPLSDMLLTKQVRQEMERKGKEGDMVNL